MKLQIFYGVMTIVFYLSAENFMNTDRKKLGIFYKILSIFCLAIFTFLSLT